MRTAAAGVALLVALVSGCSDSDAAPAEVGPLASGSASPAGTPSPGSAVPRAAATTETEVGPVARPLPPAAGTGDSAGASAFARHYMATLQEALATGDASALEALSDPGCGGCRNLVAAIEEATKAGRHVRGAELAVAFAEAPAVRDGETTVDLRYQRRAGDVVDASGDVVETIAPEGPIDTQLRLKRTGSSWSVLGFRQVVA